MPIRFACEHCGQKLSVSSRKAGVVAKCPKCQQKITVPERAPQESDGEHPPAAEPHADDPFAQFVVYDDDVEWVYEDDVPEHPAPSQVRGSTVATVAVPRSMLYAQGILLATVALIAFVLGMLVSGGGKSTDVAATARPCTLSGQIEYQAAGTGTLPDDGAVVIVLPRNERLEFNQRASIEGLRPNDPQPIDENTGLRKIRTLGGAYTRTDASGRFRLRLPASGDYFVLFVSRNSYRSGDEELDKADLAQLGRYFLPAVDLLGNSKYQWSSVALRRDQTMNVAF